MFFSLALILIATASGALATYLYDEEAPLYARVCAGACTGLAALGLLGFVFASFRGLTALSLLLATVFVASPLALLVWNEKLREAVRLDLQSASRGLRRAVLHPSWSATGYFVFYLLIALLLWTVFERALFELPDGIYTGVQNNYGDLPFHISVINSFVRGENFPPQDPTFAGVRFTYPFLSDFVAAMLMRAGASLRDAMLMENFVLALSFVGLLHRWTLLMVRDRLAALVAPMLILFSGGLGWLRFLRDVRESRVGLFAYLAQLTQHYTISGTAWRWGNALTTLLVPQRGILFGLPLAVLIFTLFWQMTRESDEEDDDDAEARGNERDADTRGSDKAAKEKRKIRKDKQNYKDKRGYQDKQGSQDAVRSNKAGHERIAAAGRFQASSLLSISPLRRMIAAGLIAGLLPLVHAHTLMVVMLVGGLIAVLREDWRAWAIGLSALAVLTAGLARLTSSIRVGEATPFSVKAYAACAALVLAGGALVWLLRGAGWREWMAFFVVASLMALPQLWWAARGSSAQAASFIGWHLGWDHGDENVWRFWLKNTGLFIPLLLAALLWFERNRLVKKRLLFYYLPFTLCFIIPNLVLLAPWVWDNIKVLFYWYVASVPLVALLLARWWRSGAALRAAAVGCFMTLTLAGALDVWSVVGSETSKIQEFEREGISFAEVLEQKTPPRSLVLHAPTFNHPVFLTGRQSFMGYPGHIWTHGLQYREREAEIKRIYAGAPDAASLLSKAGIEYIVVSPLERQLLVTINEAFLSQYPLIVESGAYRLYKIK